MGIDFELRVQDRQDDRVQVQVRLCPGTLPTNLEGVSVELSDLDGNCVGSRVLLPISGTLSGPLATLVELRACGPMPHNARILGRAWSRCDEVVASCPAKPCQGLEDHARGATSAFQLADLDEAEPLEEDETARFVVAFPWVHKVWGELADRFNATPTEIEPDPTAESIAEDLGLDEDSATWLKELLEEDDL